MTVRTAGATTFKNYVQQNWKVEEDSPDRIYPSDRNQIKKQIITFLLMSTSSKEVHCALSDAVSIIAREDFPHKWHELLGEMVTQLGVRN